MKSTRAMIGMPCFLDGKRLGRVSGVTLDHALTRLENVHIECGIRGSRTVGAQDIRLLGAVSIMLSGKGKRMIGANAHLFRRAILPDGTRAGVVREALIEPETLAVGALELSKGYVDDLLGGRSWIRDYSIQPKSGDVLLHAEGGEDG